MKKRIKISRLTRYSDTKIIKLPRRIYINADLENESLSGVSYKVISVMNKQWTKDNKELAKYKEFVDVILKHMTNNGWSNDFTIDFWNMNEKELKVIHKFMNKYKEKK